MQLRGATSHHHPLPVEGRPQPTRLRSVARTARKPPRPARRASLTAMPAAPAVYCSAARASQLRLRVAPGSGQPAAPSALRGGSWIPRAQMNRGRSTVHVWAHVGTNQCPRCFCLRFGFRCSKHAVRVPRWRRGDRSLRNHETSYIRLLRACLSQFLLKEPIPPKNLLYVSPSSLASYLTKASSMVQR